MMIKLIRHKFMDLVSGWRSRQQWSLFLIKACIIVCFLCTGTQPIWSQCQMSCHSSLNVSLGSDCEATITYTMTLVDPDNPFLCNPNGPWAYTVIVMDKQGIPIPTSPKVTSEYIGKDLTVKTKHWKSGNSCWTNIHIEDKASPKLKCPANVTVACSDPTSPSFTGEPTVTDCSDFTLTYQDQKTTYGCSNPTAKIIRTWIAQDVFGNKSTCAQTISVAKADISKVVFPKNLDDISAPALNCTLVNLDPDVTGWPTINGSPVKGGGTSCTLSATYVDQKIDICTGMYKILRTWTILDWCTSQLATKVQIIAVLDKKGPIIVCPTDMTVATNGYTCKGDVNIPPATVYDECSDVDHVDVQISGFQQINGNGGILKDVPAGIHTVEYTAVDDCGNVTTCSFKLHVKDLAGPTMICKSEIIVALNNSGLGIIPAKAFDQGSFDNCCMDKLDVKKLEDPDTKFGPTVQFDCQDAGKSIMVVLRGTDCNGNSNLCMINASIQDKSGPSIQCPPNVTITCMDDLNNLDKYGQPTVLDNCGSAVITTSIVDLTDACGSGSIKRVFTAKDANGVTAQCTQFITVKNPTAFNPMDITWPLHYETNDCTSLTDLEPDDLPAPYKKPVLKNTGCNLVGISYKDDVYSVAPPSCVKIIRTWTVLDWCAYKPNVPNPPGKFTYEQVIKIVDVKAPVLACPVDVIVSSTDNNCQGAQVTLPPLGVMDCNPNVLVTNSVNGGGANASGYYPLGTTIVTFTAKDGCNNSSTCSMKVVVKDGKKPTPVCIVGLSTTIMPSSQTVPIWATDFEKSSYDNCTPHDQLVFYVAKSGTTGGVPPNTKSLIFTCDDVGTQSVELWVCDASGNCDYCTTTIEVQDNNDICPDSIITNINVAGLVKTENGNAIKDVKVQVANMPGGEYVTGNDGFFTFKGLSPNTPYSLDAGKNVNQLNGVNTYDIILIQSHLLQSKILISPYKLIAADADNNKKISVADIVMIRKMILGLASAFNNGPSWRFVDASYVFPVPTNPWSQPFPETVKIQASGNKMNSNFIGIKTGDVDGTAKANEFMSNDTRSGNAIAIHVEDREFQKGDRVRITFHIEDAIALEGIQFSLIWDPKYLSMDAGGPGSLPDMDESNFNTSDMTKGRLSCSWNTKQVQSLIGKKVFNLEGTALAHGTLKQVMRLGTTPTESLGFVEGGEIQDLQIHWQNPVEDVQTELTLWVEPNPYRDQARLEFTLPEAMECSIRIHDAAGRKYAEWKKVYEQGRNSIEIPNSLPEQAGMFIIDLITPQGTQECRLIRIKE